MSDELAAARARRDALRDELARLDHVLHETDAQRARRDALARTLDDVSDTLDRARKRTLPLLSRVRIASPCDARWEDMEGDDRARHCASCDKTVFDFSAMRADEAEALLRAHGESLCAQFFQRADGTILTADCAVGVRRKMRRKLLAATVATITMGVASLAAAAVLAPARESPAMHCQLRLDGAIATRDAREEITRPRAAPNTPSWRGGVRRGGIRLRTR
ncbi:hypothetical protein [Sandaracinus amylolyticus]|uniref:Uncharacterized protein n=1 Tax=Sandaracinus amylolyticus TaxID=927083 RepID=A0A0F6W8A3_9BACT|nr:hypothetical protein [Sandaracinus amylolyticus]AKF10037.1 hypothetical protein DB32_007186 [Sandaracinus amylolyticus]